MEEREREINKRLHDNKRENQLKINQTKNYLGLNFEDINRMGGNIPGFQIIKNRVIKPLLVATEKVVEYYLNDEKPVNSLGPMPEGND